MGRSVPVREKEKGLQLFAGTASPDWGPDGFMCKLDCHLAHGGREEGRASVCVCVCDAGEEVSDGGGAELETLIKH